MKPPRCPVSCLLAVGALLTGGGTHAQEQDGWRTNVPTGLHVVLAGALEWPVPFLGHAYAGDASRGKLPNLVAAGGIATAIAACATGGVGISGQRRCWSERGSSSDVFALGFWTFLVGRTWAIVSAMKTARDQRASPSEKPGSKNAELDLSVTPAGQIAMGVAMSF